VDGLDAGLGESAVGDEADLPAGETDGFMALGVHGHGHEGDGDLFAGGEELVEFALGGRGGGFLSESADGVGEVDQIIGGVAHGRDDDDDAAAGLLGGDGASGGAMDAGGVGHGGAA